MALRFNWYTESFPLAQTFRISRGAKTHANVLVLEISLNTQTSSLKGWAEAVPYARYNESIESVIQELELAAQALHAHLHKQNKRIEDNPETVIQEFLLNSFIPTMPAGSARNLVDCACWDLLAKVSHRSVAALLNIPLPTKATSAQTLSVDSIESMRVSAAKLAHLPLLKVKLDGHDVLEKMQAIHKACPNSDFIIDANEAWDFKSLDALLPKLKAFRVVLIEQPLPADNDRQLINYTSPIPLCADESCHTSKGIDELSLKYQAVNIKLDKTGGLSEAIKLLNAAKEHNMQIMLGCMVASSLSMAPIYLLADKAEYIDLDGPVLVAKDRDNGFVFKQGSMSPSKNHLWGES